MKYRVAAGMLASLPLLACGGTTPGVAEESSLTQETGATSTPDPTSPTGSSSGGTPTSGPVDTGTSVADTNDDDDHPFKFDVHGVDDAGACEGIEAGIYCIEGRALECDGNGNATSDTLCTPNVCLAGVGCVECLDGQYHCQGPRVMQCNAAAVPPQWQEIEVCDPAVGQGCDQEIGECTTLQPVGEATPTGDYYQYAFFQIGASPFTGGYDVDSFENRIYVSSFNFNAGIDVYEVELLDSDNDGQLEPNQHPDNPEDQGPIEERTLTFIESIPGVQTYSSVSEVYVGEDSFFVGGTALTEYQPDGSGATLFSTPPGWLSSFSQIGYDEINGVWYSSNEGARRVFQYDSETETWGIAFLFPPLAGDHMDGLEIVTDPNTGTPYVYVSDMTSDFIGQYRLDPELGWVQENLFQYVGTGGALVEGMGFGALNHFWATGGDSVYEVGGGDLSTYVEPPPPN